MASDSYSESFYSTPLFADNVDDNDDYDEVLINKIKNYRCIWHKKCCAYKETPKKNEAWKAIASKLSRPGLFLISLI